ncbi:MAG: glucosamine--fructose-6-phosphate aminotransferase (isomerizing) [Acidobacteria bacterium]|nr:glucosamine--fructose-6-phosphate aminotransferase (isomerizing) [Acidobacteriota bacterium]
MPDSILLSEINEQPDVLRRLLREGEPNVRRVADALASRGLTGVVIAARGSSDNAARYGQYVLGALNRLNVGLATPSLYTRYQAPPRLNGALVVGISQSGESPDLVAVVEEGRRQGCPTLAITNVEGSPITRVADHTLLLGAGRERSIAATKTYTSQLMTIAMLSAALGGDARRWAELAEVPDQVSAALQLGERAQAAAAMLKDAGHGVVIGRGYNYATAFEMSLKAKELAYVAVEPYSAADFQHGPIALVEAGFAAIVVNVAGAVCEEVEALLNAMIDRGARPAVVSNIPSSLAVAAAPLPLPENLPEWVSPIAAVVPGQLLAFHLSRARGFDPDQPRGLNKVTRTT